MDIKPIRNTERGAVDTTGHSAQFSWLALLLLVIFIASRGAADSGLKEAPAACSGSDFGPTIVIGFVGGFVHRDNARHIEVQLAKRLSAECPGGVRAETFENRHSEQAHRAILRWLDADGDGKLSDVERGRARIILYGHSWGGAAVTSLARELQGEGIPVLLTVQVDSIGKDGDDDRVVPANVARQSISSKPVGRCAGKDELSLPMPHTRKSWGIFELITRRSPRNARPTRGSIVTSLNGIPQSNAIRAFGHKLRLSSRSNCLRRQASAP